jgi:hypothetical protein
VSKLLFRRKHSLRSQRGMAQFLNHLGKNSNAQGKRMVVKYIKVARPYGDLRWIIRLWELQHFNVSTTTFQKFLVVRESTKCYAI